MKKIAAEQIRIFTVNINISKNSLQRGGEGLINSVSEQINA